MLYGYCILLTNGVPQSVSYWGDNFLTALFLRLCMYCRRLHVLYVLELPFNSKSRYIIDQDFVLILSGEELLWTQHTVKTPSQ